MGTPLHLAKLGHHQRPKCMTSKGEKTNSGLEVSL